MGNPTHLGKLYRIFVYVLVAPTANPRLGNPLEFWEALVHTLVAEYHFGAKIKRYWSCFDQGSAANMLIICVDEPTNRSNQCRVITIYIILHPKY